MPGRSGRVLGLRVRQRALRQDTSRSRLEMAKQKSLQTQRADNFWMESSDVHVDRVKVLRFTP